MLEGIYNISYVSSEVHLKILLNDLKYCCKMLGVGTEFFEVVYACQSF